MCQCVRVPSVRVRAAVIVHTRDKSRCEPKRNLIIAIGSIRSKSSLSLSSRGTVTVRYDTVGSTAPY